MQGSTAFLKFLFSFLLLMFCFPSLLRGRESDGFPQYQERFIRDCIRKFPYCEATLLQQLVRSFTSVEIVSGENTRKNKRLFRKHEQRTVLVMVDGNGCQVLIFLAFAADATLIYRCTRFLGQRPNGVLGADPGSYRSDGVRGR